VREFSVPATTEVGPDEAITDLLATNVADHPDQVGLRIQRDGRWEECHKVGRPERPNPRLERVT